MLRATELAPPEHRAAVFRRRLTTSAFREWYLSVAVEMRQVSVSLLDRAKCTVEHWLQVPFVGDWPFGVSRKGLKLRTKNCEWRAPGKTWGDMPGCAQRKNRVVLAIRGASLLARRLDVLGIEECKWPLCATHNSDETRNPRSERQYARRLVRGSPTVGQSVDCWPGVTAARRPEVAPQTVNRTKSPSIRPRSL